MPISYRVDDSRRRVYTRAEGLITYRQLRAHMNAEVGEEASSYGELFDCTDATTNITPEEVRLLVDERVKIARLRPSCPVAVVATNKCLFGMLRMYDIMTEQVRPIRIFSDLQDAEEWLNEVERPIKLEMSCK